MWQLMFLYLLSSTKQAPRECLPALEEADSTVTLRSLVMCVIVLCYIINRVVRKKICLKSISKLKTQIQHNY